MRLCLVHMAASVSLAQNQSDAVMVCGINSWSLLLDSQELVLAPGEESYTTKPESGCINIGLLGTGSQEKKGVHDHGMWQEDSGTKIVEFPCSKRIPQEERTVQSEAKKWRKKTRLGLLSTSHTGEFQRVCSFTHSTGTDQTSRTCQLLCSACGKDNCTTQRALPPLLLHSSGGKKNKK